ncbi:MULTISPECIES: alpha-glucan family phosphorylase [Halopseudomonas]|uniref:Alpha-glucan family phosphorylase n=1 Tax=Halopseudomonas bauzanensis TaxID=653930 RepID=A0A4U0YM77_9GAMM|nr:MULTISPECIES: alpha-glucan family phosphorylase [Halopseudomonas]TKA93320.1 alpha-glucan family phosphorylase [Halopseudomonas bauzanensis]WGK61214.1 alpha-glucan family phosphorylase [Halopseudomonas sp. SMJS2]
MTQPWPLPWEPDPQYRKRVAYFSMEYAIDQPLKIYSGGLGFLAGSHMRSAFDLRQNLIGIGMLWKNGYYDQVRHDDQSMRVQFQKKYYPFLVETGICVPVTVNGHQVWVKALRLPPEVFNTAPLYLLTTDIPENDYLAQTITHRLYDTEPSTRIAQSIVLGLGGARVVEQLGGADIHHLNESHGLPLAFHLLARLQDSQAVRRRIVFTTHTPEKAGNPEHDMDFLRQMGFFGELSEAQVAELTGMRGARFSHTLAALRLAGRANGVSRLHGEVANRMWGNEPGIRPISSVTNAQNARFWQDQALRQAVEQDDDAALVHRKRELKRQLFQVVADQTGKLFDPEVLTIVWARRFAAYKRADLLLHDVYRFCRLIEQQDRPVQLIWAGKPFPFDQAAIDLFNRLIRLSYKTARCAVLTGYEIQLSRLLKQGADVWLNTPQRLREASGTSGMTAAMNGAVNLSISDGWVPEFARDGLNCLLIPDADPTLDVAAQDAADYSQLMNIIEHRVRPLYYDQHEHWLSLVKQGMHDVLPRFDSDRMADEYYRTMYGQ